MSDVRQTRPTWQLSEELWSMPYTVHLHGFNNHTVIEPLQIPYVDTLLWGLHYLDLSALMGIIISHYRDNYTNQPV